MIGIILLIPIECLAHADHGVKNEELGKWLHWIGNFHLILLHFPIALFTMTFISEICGVYFKKLIFDQAARFMLISGAALAIPTALLGLAFSYNVNYEGSSHDFFWWHRFLGIFMTLFACIVVYLRENYPKNYIYWFNLSILFLGINITAFFGGGLTFGELVFIPPF